MQTFNHLLPIKLVTDQKCCGAQMTYSKGKGKGIAYSVLKSVKPELIPVSRQSTRRWRSHKPGARLPLLSTRLVFTFSATERHRPLTGTKLYCLVNRGTCVWTTCPKSLPDSVPGRSRTEDLSDSSPVRYRYRVFTWSSKRPALARVFWVHLLEVCWIV